MTEEVHQRSDGQLRALHRAALERAGYDLRDLGRYALGPFGFSVRGVAHPTLRQMLRHLLPQQIDVPAQFEIDVLDGRTSAGPPPAWNLPHSDARHLERLHLSVDHSLAAQYNEDTRTWMILDRGIQRALLWIEDLDRLPHWDITAPFRTLLHWYLVPTPLFIAHAAAIVSDGGAILLVGRGGSGKSTTVATAVRHGLQVSGDDLVIVGRYEGIWQVFALYDTLKLDPSAIGRTGLQLDPKRLAENEKVAYRYSDLAPGQLVPLAPLRAIAEASVVGRPDTTLAVQTSAAVLRALAPSTLFLLRGYEQHTWSKLVGLTRATPSWSLQLGNDLEGVVSALKHLP